MKMLLTTLVLFGWNLLMANPITTSTTELPIQTVTIYQEGAQVERKGTAQILKGTHKLKLTGVSLLIDQSSLQFYLGDNVSIQSIVVKRDEKSVREKDAAKQLRDKIKTLKDSIYIAEGRITTLEGERALIRENATLDIANNDKVNEVKRYADYYRNQSQHIFKQMLDTRNKVAELKKNIEKLQKEISALGKSSESMKNKIIVNYRAKESKTIEATVTYLVTGAFWKPKYDLKVDALDAPLNLDFNASIYQRTGVDWDHVKISLATGFPSRQIQQDQLDPYYLTPNNYYSESTQRDGNSFRGEIYGVIMDSSGEPLISASVYEKGTSNGTSTDLDGSYRLRTVSSYPRIEVSYTGFETQLFTPYRALNNIRLKEGALLDEVVVAGYAPNASGNADRDNYRSRKTTYVQPLGVEKNITQRLYKIELPYTVKSEEEGISIPLINHRIPARYVYEITPKLSTNAYLIAEIKDWYQYDLMEGNVSVYLNKVYQGSYLLDLSTEESTLKLSAGIDNNINVVRKNLKTYSDRNLLGTKVTVQKVWQIDIHNGNRSTCDFVIYDQLPVSKSDNISVKVKELTGGKVDESTGEVTWKMPIASNQKKQLKLAYEVKSRRSDRVIVE